MKITRCSGIKISGCLDDLATILGVNEVLNDRIMSNGITGSQAIADKLGRTKRGLLEM